MLFFKKIAKETIPQLLFSLLFVCLFYPAYSQITSTYRNAHTVIKGVIVDSTSKIPLANVKVTGIDLSTLKSLEGGLTNDSGAFEIIISTGIEVQLSFAILGYKEKSIQVSALNQNHLIELDTTKLFSLSRELQEVKVTAKKPIIEQNLDKITYNVDADPDSKTETAFEILRKVPLLSIDADDNLQLNGNNSFRILINGKPSSLFLNNQTDLFKNMPASMLKKIEVLTVPSAKYEAQGVGGIINLTTYAQNLRGYNGGLNLRLNTPKGIAANSNLSANVGRFSLNGNVAVIHSTSPTNRSTYLRQDKSMDSKLAQQAWGNNNSQNKNSGIAITYEPNHLNTITASYALNQGQSKNQQAQQSALTNAAGTLTEAFFNQSLGKNQTASNDFALDYQRSFSDNAARQFIFSYRWGKYVSENTSDFSIQPTLGNKSRIHNTDNNDASGEHTLQADYVQPLKKHTLELGTHATFRKSSSDYIYKAREAGTEVFILDTSQSNNYQYQEAIYAAYASLNLIAGKWGFRIGARLEQANINARFISSGTTTVHEYFNPIPNLTVSRQLKGNSRVKLSYTQRLQRPDLYYLDPFVDRTDPYNISYGNPDLSPALAHVFNFSYNTFLKKTSLNLDVLHQFTNNAIEQLTMLGTDTITRTTFSNIGKSRNSSLTLSGSTTFLKKVMINLNSALSYVQFTRNQNGKPYQNGGVTFNVSGSVNYRYKQWRAGCNIGYYAPNVLVQGRTAHYVSNSITLNKYFLKNNMLTIGLAVNSPFQEYRRSFTEINAPTFYQMRKSLTVIRRFTLSVNYRFTKVQGSNNQDR